MYEYIYFLSRILRGRLLRFETQIHYDLYGRATNCCVFVDILMETPKSLSSAQLYRWGISSTNGREKWWKTHNTLWYWFFFLPLQDIDKSIAYTLVRAKSIYNFSKRRLTGKYIQQQMWACWDIFIGRLKRKKERSKQRKKKERKKERKRKKRI